MTTDKGLQTHFVPDSGSALVEGTTNQAIRDLDLNKADAGHIHAAVEYNANGVTVNTGTLVSGDEESLWTPYDGNVLEIDEVIGTPGFDVEVDFASVVSLNEVHVRVFYDGSVTHDYTIDIYNYNTASWDTLDTEQADAGYTWHNYYIADDSDYISGGAVIVRFYHTSAGNTSHVLYLDHVEILQTTGVAASWDGDITDIDETSSTDIGEAIADTDQGIIYNTSGSAWVRFAWSRVKTYIQALTDTLYIVISGNVSQANMEELTDGSTTTLHTHGYSFVTLPAHGLAGTIGASASGFIPFYYFGINTTSFNFKPGRDGVIKNLRITTLSAQPATGTLVITVYKGGSPTTITITVPAGGAAGDYTDLTHTVNVSAGDAIIISIVNNATSDSAQIGISGLEYGSLVSAT